MRLDRIVAGSSSTLLIATLTACSGSTGAGLGSGAGAGAGESLDPGAVQAIAPGNASATSMSGTYRVQRITRACSGTCATTSASLNIPVSACDVGAARTVTFTVKQNSGKLAAEADDTPSLYAGALNADGSFELGAYATQDATVQITVRATGTLTAPAAGDAAPWVAPAYGSVVGNARSHTWGNMNGPLDCYGEYDLVAPVR